MSFAAFVSGVMQPTVDRYKAEQETKRRLEEHAGAAKLDKALNEWEFYSPDERAAVAPELDKILKQKKGYSADLLGKGEQGYKFLQGALAQQKPIESLEAGARKSAALPVSIPRRMSGPETTGAIEEGRDFEVGPSIQSTTPIALPSEPVSLPPLPVEGADIPRVDSNVLQLPASQRALAAKDYQTRQRDMLSRQSKVGEIGTSPLGAEDKEVAIESLYLPPGVLSARERAAAIRERGAAGGNRDIGLGITEMVSPDGAQRMYVQSTRGGGFMDARTGKLLDPAALEGWTKVFNQSLQVFPNQEGSIDVFNRQRVGQQMNQTGTVAGTVPDVHPAQTVSPLVDAAGNVAGRWGSRTGGPTTSAEGRPLRRTPVPLTEAKEMATLDKDEEFVQSLGKLYKPEFVGPAQGRWDDVMANSPDIVRNTVGYKGSKELAAFRVANAKILNSVIKFITGAQMGEQEAERIKKEVPHTNQQPKDWEAAYAQTLQNIQMMKQRMKELGRWTLPDRNASEGTQTAAPTSGSAPKVGDHREFPNGSVGVWDGKGWKKLNR